MSILKIFAIGATAIAAGFLAASPAAASTVDHRIPMAKPEATIVRVHTDGYWTGRSHRHVYRDGVVVDAPTTYVDTRGRRIWVDAPFTAIRVHPRGVWVRAPFVDLYVRR